MGPVPQGLPDRQLVDGLPVRRLSVFEIPPGDQLTQFNDALRQTLAAALTLPRETDYAEHFNYSKKFDLFWYFRVDRLANPFSRPSALLIELRFPDDIEIDVPWGFRSGEIATIRWLMDEDRKCAEDFFPMLDS